MRVGEPGFGQAVMCECLERDVRARHLARLQERSNLEQLSHLTFESFDTAAPGVMQAYRLAKQFAAHPDGWLLFYGGFGTGKTHLAAAIAHELVRQGTSVLFQVAPLLLNEIRAAFNPDSPLSSHEIFDSVLQAPVLILDDLGEENETPWVREQIFTVFNHRYNRRMPTVVTTNREIKNVHSRLESRFLDRTVCSVTRVGERDFRQLGPELQRKFKRGGLAPRR